ncbi:MAG: polysaccharide deacetylase family protein [Candidatus Cloacimonetes bacterium]|nr:polysaccharide deacetylase family protein [Candidatus Cloacimonadota bacterium]
MEIKIGLCTPNPGWEIIITQLGISFEKLDINSKIDFSKFNLLIPNSELAETKKQDLEAFISNGGFAILDKDTFPYFFDSTCKKRKITYIIPGEESIFHSLGLVDFYTDFYIAKGESCNQIDKDCSVYESKIGKGKVVILPFSVNETILSNAFKRKRFYADRKELPSEVVSRVSKSKIRDIIFTVISRFFQQMNIPVVEKDVYPDKTENAFMFRIDTDFCSAQDAQNLYELCKKYDIKATWFVDTHDETLLKGVYPNFTDHEIALHCEHHKVHKTYKENYHHLEHALDTLRKNSIEVKGFAAPFGEWNESLGHVLKDLGFDYSSEFSLDYDDVAFHPFFKDHFSPVLQIPIHPISIGRLRRSHFMNDEMVQYYKNFIDYNFSRNVPAIIYHHPHHKKLDVIEEVFLYIKNKNAWNPTMYEFSSWWKKRLNNKFWYDSTNDTITIQSNDSEMTYSVITDQGSVTHLKPNIEYKINSLMFTKVDPLLFDENKSMRQFYWRDILQNHEHKKAKKQ